ncbi:FecCD family ABC transporter permease [Enterococcus camelliae]|uniref:FecCD family ABC transporter permease n=1 Tax=Enterococcus camelliae TaxID=453959 RepID=A0ABW5TG29_9ENTE
MQVFKTSLGFILLVFLLCVSILLGISLGTLHIPLADTYTFFLEKLSHQEPSNKIFSGVIWQIRMPRVLLGVLLGAGLALCGVVMQAVVQNPLAEPFLLGISAGGYLGATVFIILGGSFIGGIASANGLAVTAFLGALVASIGVIGLASYRSKMTTTKLILSGTIMNALCTSTANFIMVFAGDDSTVSRVTFWTMSSLASTRWENLTLPAIAVILGGFYFITQSRTLNLLLQGEETAITLGLRVSAYRNTYLIVVALLTGILVSTCGIIGFVGLIIPHISRAMVGPNHHKLLPVSMLVGAIFLVNMDMLARTLIANVELPIGIFTSMIGAPFFAWILVRKNYQFKE